MGTVTKDHRLTLGAALCRPDPAAVAREQRHWREQWLAFPTVAEHDGELDFWHVPADTGVYQDDWPCGERLASETIAHMRRFPEGASVLRRILARLDPDSTVAQGFVNHLEEVLARPDLYPPQAPTEN